jgi:hypothetical protein
LQVLEATSNEPWGPHGTIMADIAQATRNFNDYHLIMAILYKRLNDTGRNWRHVYKSLTVLEYLVANGSERVIDELREHTYHIQVSQLTPYWPLWFLLSKICLQDKNTINSLLELMNDMCSCGYCGGFSCNLIHGFCQLLKQMYCVREVTSHVLTGYVQGQQGPITTLYVDLFILLLSYLLVQGQAKMK